jgi:hypothetical protein
MCQRWQEYRAKLQMQAENSHGLQINWIKSSQTVTWEVKVDLAQIFFDLLYKLKKAAGYAPDTHKVISAHDRDTGF